MSIRTKGGTRYFNQGHIKKLSNIKNILFEDGKHNYSLDLVNKIISSKKLEKQINYGKIDKPYNDKNETIDTNNKKLKNIIIKLKRLI